MEQREKALARRHASRGNDLADHTKVLLPLEVGQVVPVQNQMGNNPLRWDKSGQVVEVLPFDQYRIKMDGTGRSSLRNRKFLRPITPFSSGSTTTLKNSNTFENDPVQTVDDEISTQPNPHVDHDSSASSTTTSRRSTRCSKPPVRLGLSTFSCSRSSQGGGHR